MANINLKFACVVLLFLIIHHHQQQHLYVQGRHFSKSRENITNGDRDRNSQERKRVLVEYQVNAFRPTSSGHSPGVGHYIND